MSEPKKETPPLPDRMIEHDGDGLVLDNTEREGEPFDFAIDADEPVSTPDAA